MKRRCKRSEKLKDAKERSYLLEGLAAEWASLDEEKALRITDEISSEFPESLSYGLVADWNPA